jgi:hypothetical protein
MAIVRVSESLHQTLRHLSTVQGKSMQAILEQAVEEHRRAMFMTEMNAAFQALRDNPEAWQAEQEERALWEQTLMDGDKHEQPLAR